LAANTDRSIHIKDGRIEKQVKNFGAWVWFSIIVLISFILVIVKEFFSYWHVCACFWMVVLWVHIPHLFPLC
jgi:hypothetical protein